MSTRCDQNDVLCIRVLPPLTCIVYSPRAIRLWCVQIRGRNLDELLDSKSVRPSIRIQFSRVGSIAIPSRLSDARTKLREQPTSTTIVRRTLAIVNLECRSILASISDGRVSSKGHKSEWTLFLQTNRSVTRQGSSIFRIRETTVNEYSSNIGHEWSQIDGAVLGEKLKRSHNERGCSTDSFNLNGIFFGHLLRTLGRLLEMKNENAVVDFG